LYYYRSASKSATPATVRQRFAGYDLADIEVVAAFDVDPQKVGIDLSEAIFAPANCAAVVHRPPKSGVVVARGPLLDGLTPRIRKRLGVSNDEISDTVYAVLTDSRADVLVILLPSGAQAATHRYVEAALAAGIGIVNAIPVNIANNHEIAMRATEAKVPIIGDDIKSQIGATIVHKAIAELFPLRSALLKRTIQLDWAGDSDFENLVSEQRYELGKRASKTHPIIWNQPNRDEIEKYASLRSTTSGSCGTKRRLLSASRALCSGTCQFGSNLVFRFLMHSTRRV